MSKYKHLIDNQPYIYSAMRAVFGQIIAEKNKLKAENRILKQNAKVVVDMRPNQVIYVGQVHHAMQQFTIHEIK